MSTTPKILVIRGGAIGDFILTLPAVAALRRRFPDVHLEILGYPHIARLALLGGLVDRVRSIEASSLAPFFARHGELPSAMRDYFAEFALILSYLYDPDAIFQENIARCTEAQFIQGPHRPEESAGRHATDVFLQPLERLAIFDADPVPRLTVAPTAPDSGRPSHPDGREPTWIAVHPGSGSPRKNWPETRWAELLGRLGPEADAHLRLLLVGGEAEGGCLERLARRPPCPVALAAHLPLPELAARLASCQFFLGHDSGITHLAAAVGLPGIALWGETVETVWRPRSERIQLLRAGAALTELPVETVLAALRERRQAVAAPQRSS